MKIMPSKIAIKEFIVHDIPRKLPSRSLGSNAEELQNVPVLSDVETPFSSKLVDFFKSKFSSSIGSSNSVEIKYTDEKECVPSQIEQYFLDHSKSITTSQKIAKKLFEIQNARNTEGLLLFVYGVQNQNDFLAILKVEREEGVQIDIQKDDEGKTSFNLNYIENLMLTKKTKLFKIALFIKDGNETKGFLSDNQIGQTSTGNYADFFMSEFLSCELISEPPMVTKLFFEETQKFVNSSNLSPNDKARIITHLVSHLTNNSASLNIQRFAEDSFPSNKADEYLTQIQNLCGCSLFVKDTSLISKKLKKQLFSFDSGISVTVPSELDDEELIKYEETEDNKMKIQIVDSVKEIRSK